MNKYKALAIVFALLSFGGIQESFRIFTSSAPDIAENRTWLMPMGIILPCVFLYLTVRYWRKSKITDRKIR
jgi:hypothetical protein